MESGSTLTRPRKTAKNAAKHPWDQRAFETFYNDLSPERRQEDEACLQRLFKAAQKSPSLARQLEWAKENGIRFFIDRTTMAGGYYAPGTGVVAIAKNSTKTDYFAEVLGHEIRHAEQDYRRLIANLHSSPLLESIMLESLLEVDATMHGKTAYNDYNNPERYRLRSEGQYWLEDWYNAQMWRRPRSLAISYANATSRDRAITYHLAGKEESIDFRHEFPDDGAPLPSHNNFFSSKDFSALGEKIHGENYIEGTAKEEFLKKMMRPALAARFFDAALPAKDISPYVRKCLTHETLNRCAGKPYYAALKEKMETQMKRLKV